MSPSVQLADIHSQFGAARDELYRLISKADFASAAAKCDELRALFSRYCEVRAEMAHGARAEFATNQRWAKSKSRAHLAAVVCSGDTEKVDELLTREAIASLDKGPEQEGDE